MARHVWLVNKFKQETVDLAEWVLRTVLNKRGVTFEECCVLVGYAVERSRQEGGSKLIAARVISMIATFNDPKATSYMNGKNNSNYRYAGYRLIEAMASKVELEGAPAEAVWDLFNEKIALGELTSDTGKRKYEGQAKGLVGDSKDRS